MLRRDACVGIDTSEIYIAMETYAMSLALGKHMCNKVQHVLIKHFNRTINAEEKDLIKLKGKSKVLQ